MDSYTIRKINARSFTVTVTSPSKQSWKTLQSRGLKVTDIRSSSDAAGQFYTWTIQAEKPGIYELRMVQQSDDGAYRKVVIPIIAEAA
ncbi:hypothetical protein McpSp1_07320 [Methanocorpusculaceae archaeon Sp1]|uniref:Uncharacterized protein n=1 Tax=Methanorbis furvi TaxID=3028299 RepID=A0AAE4MDL5_9EURY|nr:hypothetical protein [Methanocorpusculaceae archaeon Sp1]MDV0442436.1 hypothetical protein [Methanocorpusculaceae archaeon Ag1]